MLKLPPPIWALIYVLTAAVISWFFDWSKVPGLPLAPLGISLVAISWIPPHDRVRGCGLPEFLYAVQIGRNEPMGMASLTSRLGHRDTTSEGSTNTVNPLFDLWCSEAQCGVERCA